MTTLNVSSNSSSHPLKKYINRELSLFEFHKRVLAQAKDTEYPLLERLNFLIIFSSNLDEFFEIRVASLMQQIELSDHARARPDNSLLSDIVTTISKLAHEAVEEQYKILNYNLLPQLQGHGVHFIQYGDILEKHKEWIKDYFHNEVRPVVTPISLDPAHPFTNLGNDRGAGTIAKSIFRPNASLPSRVTMKFRLLFTSRGKGWAGSKLIGVTTGRTSLWK